MSGNRVIITPVDTYSLSTLSGESFTYKDPIETYIIYDSRPKVSLLKRHGWYREDEDNLPQVAKVPTHLLYNKTTGGVVNEVLLEGTETKKLVETGVGDTYELKPLQIKRGTIIDVFYDFSPDAKTSAENQTDPYDFPIEDATAPSRFYVTEPHIDTVSINYTCRLMAYKYDADKEAGSDQNTANGEYLDFNSDDFGI